MTQRSFYYFLFWLGIVLLAGMGISSLITGSSVGRALGVEAATGSAGGAGGNGVLASTPTAAIPAWSIQVAMDRQVFPSLLIARAGAKIPLNPAVVNNQFRLGDPNGLIGIKFKSSYPGANVKVTISCPDIAESSSVQVVVPRAGRVYEIYPKIKYRYRALLDARQKMPVDVTADVSIDDQTPESQTITAALRSINDCPYWVNPPNPNDEDGTDLSWMFAAYVNEDHPYIDGLLKDALASGAVDQFDGYQSGETSRVTAQVYAIWHVLQKRGIKYSDITANAGRNDVVLTQHVRFLDESINAQQANCVDGSVLMASVLRKVGIEPFLVVTPGHMYLGYYLDKSHKKSLALETTMMGDRDQDGSVQSAEGQGDFVEVEGLAALVPENLKRQNSYRTFCTAVKSGTDSLREDAPKCSDDPEFQMISIAEARHMGISPIAYKRK